MSEDTEWGPWIEHDGMTIPNIKGEYQIFVEGEVGENGRIYANWLIWLYKPVPGQGIITRYRLKRSTSLAKLIETVENLPVPAKEREHV